MSKSPVIKSVSVLGVLLLLLVGFVLASNARLDAPVKEQHPIEDVTKGSKVGEPIRPVKERQTFLPY